MRTTYRKITLEERHEIERLLNLKYSANRICVILERHCSVIINEIRRGGGRENYTAIKADFLSNTRYKHDPPIIELNKKVKSLELQMEILIEEINKMRKQ